MISYENRENTESDEGQSESFCLKMNEERNQKL